MKQIHSSLSWSFIENVLRKFMSFGLSIILARLLLPEDYGLVAMGIVFTGFASIFVDFGFSSALVYFKNTNLQDKNTAFAINLTIGTLIYGCFWVLSPLISKFYNQSELVSIIRISSLSFLISPFYLVDKSILQKQLEFRSITIISLISLVLSGSFGVYLAYSGWGAYALIYQSIALSILEVCGYKFYTKWIPKLQFNRDSMRKMFGYGSSLLGSRVINYWTRNADNLLIGKILGQYDLGIYNRAYTFLMIPVSTVSVVFGRVLFPVLAKLQNDPRNAKAEFVKQLRIIALVVTPISAACFVIPDLIILGLLGDNWKLVTPILKAFAPLMLIQSFGTINGAIYTGFGRTKLLLKVSLFVETIIITSIFIGVQFGIQGVIWGLYVATFINFFPSFIIPYRLIGLLISEMIMSIWKYLISGIFALTTVFFTKDYLLSLIGQNNFVQMMLATIVLMSLYIAGLLLLRESLLIRRIKYLYNSLCIKSKV